jgi:hypothetical protein
MPRPSRESVSPPEMLLNDRWRFSGLFCEETTEDYGHRAAARKRKAARKMGCDGNRLMHHPRLRPRLEPAACL